MRQRNCLVKKYGVDIDGVLMNFVSSFIEWFESRYDKTIAYEDITDYYWYECVPWITEKMFWDEFHKFGQEYKGYKNLELYKDAATGFKTLMQYGDVWIITFRPDYSREDTVRIINEIFDFPADRIIFSKGTKSVEINELGLDVFIDDAEHNVYDVATNTEAKAYIMDQPYNRDFKHDRVVRVKDWEGFLRSEKII